jgi:uroporphyrin-III C-methyltransferase
MQTGKVYLIGAGPGDPELITVKGLRCLRLADTIVYDRLVNQALLYEAPAGANLLYAGKTPGQPQLSQSAINDLLVQHAGRGETVVRLKGGDPFVFGRGGEECQALAAAGIPYEVVPGISSALAVPAYAGIPVTHRQVATSFTVVTGHTAGSDDLAIEWERLPRQGTLIILMGVGNLPRIAQQLTTHGWAAGTPTAVIQQGTTPLQTAVTGTLADIAKKAATIAPPAIIVVGEVVRFHAAIDWFESLTYNPATAVPNWPPAAPIPTTWSHHV